MKVKLHGLSNPSIILFNLKSSAFNFVNNNKKKNYKYFFHLININILFLFAYLILCLLFKKIFNLCFKTIPFKPAILHCLRVSSPIVGRSTLKSCLFFGNLISIPLGDLEFFIFLSFSVFRRFPQELKSYYFYKSPLNE